MNRGRRTRASTAAAIAASDGSTFLQGAFTSSVSNNCVTSKRKDCKLNRTNLRNVARQSFLAGFDVDVVAGAKSRLTNKQRSCLAKMQQRIDNQAITDFFQTKLKPSTIINPFCMQSNDENACDAFTPHPLNINDGNELNDNDINDSETDTENLKTFNGFNFSNHDSVTAKRNQLKSSKSLSTNDDDEQNSDDSNNSSNSNSNSSSHNSIQPTNIFLQKPVLHLNIDKSPNQPSSIIINKHLEVCPSFATTLASLSSSFPNGNNSSVQNIATANANNTAILYEQLSEQLNAKQCNYQPGRKSFNQRLQCKSKRAKKRPMKRVSNASDNGLLDAFIYSDSNSCDSGVVADKSFELNLTNGNKPTTPHRIVCPSSSPVKHYKSPRSRHQQQNQHVDISPDTIDEAINRDKLPKRRLNVIKTENESNSEFVKPSDTINAVENLIFPNVKNEFECIPKVEPKVELLPPNELKSINKRSQTPILHKPHQTKQLTDYFPVRRSIRKTKRAVEQEYLRHMEIAIEKQSEDGLIVKIFKDKGRGICAGRSFARGEFVVEYIGDLIEQNEADRREEIYAKDSAFGCYMYYFKHKEQQWCIDATAETGKLGRLVNHSRNGNLATKIVTYRNKPHLVLIAKDNIKEGEELTYDYGDRTRESLINHPWLAL